MKYLLPILAALGLFFIGVSCELDDDSFEPNPRDGCYLDGVYYHLGDFWPGDTCRICTTFCCNLFYWKNRCCLIDEVVYLNGDFNPANQCQICFVIDWFKPTNQHEITTSWTNLSEGYECADGQCDGQGNCVPN